MLQSVNPSTAINPFLLILGAGGQNSPKNCEIQFIIIFLLPPLTEILAMPLVLRSGGGRGPGGKNTVLSVHLPFYP